MQISQLSNGLGRKYGIFTIQIYTVISREGPLIVYRETSINEFRVQIVIIGD